MWLIRTADKAEILQYSVGVLQGVGDAWRFVFAVRYLYARISADRHEKMKGHGGENAMEQAEKGQVKSLVKALELLGKHFGMFTDNVRLSGDVGVQIVDDIPAGTG